MKSLLLFLLGVVVGAFAYHLYREKEAREAVALAPTPTPTPVPTPTPTPTPASFATRVEQGARDLGTQAREATRDAGSAIAAKLREWKLTPDDIREDLKRGGEVVRTKAKQAGAEFSDARVLTVVKAKYVLDRELSALDISVDVERGHVTLEGKVATPSLVGHAIALALDTEGVTHVTSRLTVTAP